MDTKARICDSTAGPPLRLPRGTGAKWGHRVPFWHRNMQNKANLRQGGVSGKPFLVRELRRHAGVWCSVKTKPNKPNLGQVGGQRPQAGGSYVLFHAPMPGPCESGIVLHEGAVLAMAERMG
jgi:hypothetical protein